MTSIQELAQSLGRGKESKVGDGWVTTCPAHDDGKASLSIRAPHGKILFKCHAGCSQEAVMTALTQMGLWSKAAPRESWKPMRPVPKDVGIPDFDHFKHGTPKRTWEYREADGNIIGYICRFEDGKGNKTIIPMSYCYSDRGRKRWSWKAFDKPRPLYNLPLFEKLKSAPVIVFEGEKAADAGQKIFGDKYVCTAWPGGAAVSKYADTKPLRGREVILWPDNDEPGQKAMMELAEVMLHDLGQRPRVVDIPDGLEEGWDVADGVPDGFQIDYHVLVSKAQDYQPISDNEVAQLNRTYAFIVTGGKPAIIHEVRDPFDGNVDVEFWSVDAFRQLLSNQLVTSGRNQVKLGDYWLTHPDRRTYTGLVFDPGRERKGYYNLWQGFSFDPDGSGSWAIFHEHLMKNVAQGSEELFNWIFGWFASMMQKPASKTGTSLSLRGKQGSGKTIVGKIFGRLIKRHYTLIDQERYLFGNFNSHMASTILLHSDEGFWGGDPRHVGKLKSLVTSDTHRVEHKGRDSTQVDNYIRLLITSNDDWVVPAAFEERRFAVIDVGNGNIQDVDFFVSMLREMENGGYEALLYDLLNFDLSQVDLNVLPDTTALSQQKEISMAPVESYWFTCLQQGCSLLMSNTKWLDVVKTSELHDDYIQYANKLGYRRHPHLNIFFKKLRSLVPEGSMERRLVGPDRQSAVTLPNLTEARKHFDLTLGTVHDWLEDDERMAGQMPDFKSMNGFDFNEDGDGEIPF